MASRRVYEIAKELGVEAKAVVRCLSDAGRFVRSAASRLTPEDVQVVSAAFGRSGDTGVPDFLAPSVGNDGRAQLAVDAEALFGPAAGGAVRRSQQASPSTRRPGSAGKRPTSGLNPFNPPTRPVSVEERRAAEREEKSVREWAERLIEASERRAWLDAGLGQGDLRLVEQCVSYALTPEQLSIRVDGTRAGDRLRGGESVGSVVARLREAGHVANTG